MQAQRCVELTGTNRSIGLIALLLHARKARQERAWRTRAAAEHPTRVMSSVLGRPGDPGGVSEPDPIPNSAVKRPSADGTSSQDAGE